MIELIDSGEIKQIIAVTDGRSNVGINPVEAAAKAFSAGITVSTIGVINHWASGNEKDIEEVEEIARAGGGLCEYTRIEGLGKTMQFLTQKTAQRTIEQIVSRQLKTIIGQDMENLEPQSRFKIVDFIEKYGDNVNLKCIIALDTSGSMRDKLHLAKKSIMELLENLQERKGNSSIAVIAYPGGSEAMCSLICGFTSEIDILRQKLESIRPGGSTPTGPAILKACELMYEYYNMQSKDEEADFEVKKYYV
ncbi:MAG: vWA domain-containing protein [Caulobacteraceae bacterium]